MPATKKKTVSKFSVDPDISKAKTISKDFYTSENIFEIAKEKIFAPPWQFTGDSNMINESNNIHPFVLFENFMNEPLVITKNKKTFFTVCPMYVRIAEISLRKKIVMQQIFAASITEGFLTLTGSFIRCRNLKE